jgi:uncharacterized membrane protein
MRSLVLTTIFILTFITLAIFFPPVKFAQQSQPFVPHEERFEGVVVSVKSEDTYEEAGQKQVRQRLEVLILDGKNRGKKIVFDSGQFASTNVRKFTVGEKVLITGTKTIEGEDLYIINDYVRREALLWLFGIFIVAALFIGTKKGLFSLLGMAFSFAIIFLFILPQIAEGQNPILVAILASLVIVPVTFCLSHGVNKKTLAAISGTFIALVITGILASIFVEAAKLSGFASEEAGFLQTTKLGFINIKGLLLAGIIISVLGIMDDITVSQAAVVYQLKKLSPKLKFGDLYFRAMEVGRDHIASVVNTLVLVYTGAALPLLLLFIDNPSPFAQVINHEVIAEEIVRTLVASIGLITAVPITTFLTALLIGKKAPLLNNFRGK